MMNFNTHKTIKSQVNYFSDSQKTVRQNSRVVKVPGIWYSRVSKQVLLSSSSQSEEDVSFCNLPVTAALKALLFPSSLKSPSFLITYFSVQWWSSFQFYLEDFYCCTLLFPQCRHRHLVLFDCHRRSSYESSRANSPIFLPITLSFCLPKDAVR